MAFRLPLEVNLERPRLALLSVSDKTGLVAFAEALVASGFSLLSTGGTAKALVSAGLPVTEVSKHTGFPEIMDGRVKTLHPRIHGGILARRSVDSAVSNEHHIDWIDIVVVNLYPFRETVGSGADFDDCVEQIDIGGPAMVRAAAKNHSDVTIVVNPADYPRVAATLAEGGPSLDLRRQLAAMAFRHTAAYDATIAAWMAEQSGHVELSVQPGALALGEGKVLRYGENPHQRAVFHPDPVGVGRSFARARVIQGKELSFNNLADLDGALRVAFDLEEPAAVIVKHMNPCGAAVHTLGLVPAFQLALSADPVSAYGGILALNRPLDGDAVRAIRQSRVFFEVIAAPGMDDEARELLAKRENLRVVELPQDWAQGRPPGFDVRRIQGGWLVQDWDQGKTPGWDLKSQRALLSEEEEVLRFAWSVSRGVRSNAIVFACRAEGGLVLNGVGAGQMSRVDSVKLAVSKAVRPTAGSVLASDAFFPFADGVEVALAAGVSAFAEPGGSLRDGEVLSAVDAAGAAMVFTGVRHFRH